MLKNLIKLILLFTALTAIGACGKKGWTQADRDQLVNGCVDGAKAKAPTIDEAKLKNYCSCYGQAIEKKYPDMRTMVTAKAEDLSKEAQNCLPLMIK